MLGYNIIENWDASNTKCNFGSDYKDLFSFNDLKCTSKCLVAYTSQYYFFHHQRDDFDERSEEKHGSVRKEISKK